MLAERRRRRLERALLSLGQRFSHPSDRETLDRLLRAARSRGSDAGARLRRRTPAPRGDAGRRTAISTSKRPALTRHPGPPPRPGAGKPALRGPARSRRWAACRTAFSTISRWRPTGTPATACSKRRASTSSPIWNGARRRSRMDANGDVLVVRPASRRPRDRSKRPALLRRRAAGRIRSDLPLGRLGQGRAAAGPFHLAARRFRSRRAQRWPPAMAAAGRAFALAGQTIDHGAPVSFLVSSSHGFGMTEGWARSATAATA